MNDEETRKELLRRAVTLLARRAHSTAELRRRLERHAGRNLLQSTLQSLESLGLLNDGEYAYNVALRRISRDGWGPQRVRSFLMAHGVAPPVIDATLGRVRSQADEGEALEHYLRLRLRRGGVPRDRAGIRRLFQHLQRRGYRDEDIRSVLGRIVPAAAWRTFDTGE